MSWFAAGKGVWRLLRNHAPAVGRYDALPTAGADFRGALGSLWGAAGVADRTVLCEKDAANAYAWNDLGRAALDTRYVNVSGDTMTGVLTIESNLVQSSTAPRYTMTETDAPTDEKTWTVRGVSGNWLWSAVADDGTTLAEFLRFQRNGNLVDLIIVNNSNLDTDVNIQGLTDNNLVYVDAGNDSIGIGTNAPTSWLDLKAGTTARAPLRIPSGTLLTTPIAGAVEYDGAQLSFTGTTTDDRGDVPYEHTLYLASDGSAIGAAIADFFGSTTAFNLPASSRWELEADLYFLKSTAGTVTLTITNSAANWTSFSGHYVMTPVGGVGTVGAPQTAGVVNTTTAAAAFPVSGSLTDATTHYMKVRATFQMNAAGNVRLRFTESAGTVTPQADSFCKVRRIPAANTGDFVA